MKVKRSTSKSQFTRWEKRLDEVLSNPANVPVATIERRYTELREKWVAVHSAHDAYVEALEAEGGEVDEEEAWMDEVTSRFDSIELRADDIIEKKKQPSASSSASVEETRLGKLETTATASSTREENGKSSVQLERIKLEHFDFI